MTPTCQNRCFTHVVTHFWFVVKTIETKPKIGEKVSQTIFFSLQNLYSYDNRDVNRVAKIWEKPHAHVAERAVMSTTSYTVYRLAPHMKTWRTPRLKPSSLVISIATLCPNAIMIS